jgi:Ca2+-binding RTX toxin-like protein
VSANDPNVPLAGVHVSFTAPSSGASAALSSTTVVLDANGRASVMATANGVAGSYVVTAAGPAGVSGTAAFHLSNTANQDTAFLAPDPLNPAKTALFVYGTSGNDVILILPGCHAGDVVVWIDGVNEGTFHPTGRIIAHGLAGDDLIAASDDVTAPAWLYGDDGCDLLRGGGGPSVLMGGAGDDALFGGDGRSLLISGSGNDLLYGGNGDSILIAGTTSYDGNDAALAAVMAEWTSSNAYATRVSHVDGQTAGGLNGAYFLNASTVQNDHAADLEVGGGGHDLFFQSLGDWVLARSKGEVAVNV